MQARRHYEIQGVLGKGGFGTVYRAALRSDDGFHREVALKILTDDDPDVEVLARFRDEARLLGRLRNPNIPGVAPPVRIGGRWAVVMDLVDGVDCHRLVKRLGSIPLRAAVELVGEVAGTLHQIHDAQDEEGRPMNLIHRDIKPSNIMVTPSGRIAVLDFGNAKATFGARESLTTDHVGGTVGYIPPERVEGEEGPAGDVFSLGVVLHLLVTGDKPPPITEGETPPEDPEAPPTVRAEVLAVAQRMRALNPKDRPTAAQVEGTCRRLAFRIAGNSLREWAATVVPGSADRAGDELVGTVLREDTAPVERAPKRSSAAPAGLFVVGAITVCIALCVGAFWGSTLVSARVVATPVVVASIDASPPPEIAGVGEIEPQRVAIEVDPRPEPAVPSPATRIARGRVAVSGAEEAWLSKGGRRSPIGAVSPGRYDLYVRFSNSDPVHAATLDVASGSTRTLDCNARFRRCVERSP